MRFKTFYKITRCNNKITSHHRDRVSKGAHQYKSNDPRTNTSIEGLNVEEFIAHNLYLIKEPLTLVNDIFHFCKYFSQNININLSS